MKQIYVVSESIDFDSNTEESIIGIFTTSDLAQAFLDSFKPETINDLTIKAYALDPFESELKQGLKYYFLRMRKNGEVFEAGVANSSPHIELLPFSSNPGFCIENNMYFHCYAKDITAAIKICNKERLKILAEKSWPEMEESFD